MSRKNMNYPIEIKLKAVEMYLEEDLEIIKIAKLLNLSSSKRGLLWVERYKKLGKDVLKERRGNCLDNVCIENFFRYLKSELIYQNNYETFKELSDLIDGYIHWYNYERFQTKLNNFTPIEFSVRLRN